MIPAGALLHVFNDIFTKFGIIHEPWLEKMLVELGKLTQKVCYLVKMDIFQSQFTH